MRTVVIRPRTFNEDTSDIELVQLQILVKDDWVGAFDQIEVWSSEYPQGPYTELTGDSWAPARVPSGAKDPASSPPTGPSVALDGESLDLLLDGDDELSIVFSGPNPVTYASAVSQVSASGIGRVSAYLTEDADFVVQGVRPGEAATLEVIGGDAAVLLGLSIDPPENRGRGKNARIPLVLDKESYIFQDSLGSKRHYYKTRFRSSTTDAVSEYSTAFSAGWDLGVSSDNTVYGYVDVVGGDGRPVSNKLVQVYAAVQTTLVEDKLVAGGRQSRVTNIRGHVGFTLVRGVTYTVSIAGTDIVRDVVAPVDKSLALFNLLGADVGVENDAFKVQVPDVVFAERRSL